MLLSDDIKIRCRTP